MPLNKKISMALSYTIYTVLQRARGNSDTPSANIVCDAPLPPHHGPMTAMLSHYPMATAGKGGLVEQKVVNIAAHS